jgi:hypothetical protein
VSNRGPYGSRSFSATYSACCLAGAQLTATVGAVTKKASTGARAVKEISGSRSALAGKRLKGMGYDKVSNIGGFNELAEAAPPAEPA